MIATSNFFSPAKCCPIKCCQGPGAPDIPCCSARVTGKIWPMQTKQALITQTFISQE